MCHFDINMRHKCSDCLPLFFYQPKRIFGECRVFFLLFHPTEQTFPRPILNSCSFSSSTWKNDGTFRFLFSLVQHPKSTLYWNNGFWSQIRPFFLLFCSCSVYEHSMRSIFSSIRYWQKEERDGFSIWTIIIVDSSSRIQFLATTWHAFELDALTLHHFLFTICKSTTILYLCKLFVMDSK